MEIQNEQYWSKSFTHMEDNKLAIIDITPMMGGIDGYYMSDECGIEIREPDEKWYYFNRINVPKEIRQRGIANKLMRELVDWADDSKVNILCEINPYGDLNLEQLISFYSKFGFKGTKIESVMFRRCI